MRKYSVLPGAAAVIAAALVSFIPGMPKPASTILLLIAIVFCVYWTRGNIIYSKAIKALRGKGKGESAEALFEKALRTGIPDNYVIFAFRQKFFQCQIIFGIYLYILDVSNSIMLRT